MSVSVRVGGITCEKGQRTLARGRLYHSGRSWEGDELHSLCAGWAGLDAWERALQRAGGFFALVHRGTDGVVAAVDRARSIPLFYAVRGRDAYVSDDARWVAEQVGAVEGHEPAATEFLLSGFVTGRDTLSASVKQLAGGDVVRFHDDGAVMRCEARRYFRYVHAYSPEADAAELAERLDAALVRGFQRLVEYAGGRTIAVPLSGGYDSRLVLALLKRLRYPSLLAFTYGRADAAEVAVSRRVAQHLGVPWHFVPYSNRRWHGWFHSEPRRRFFRMADGLSVLPLLQDWPAVGELHRQGVLPEGTVFAPGLSADLQAGSRSKRFPSFYTAEPHPRERVVEALLHSAFQLWDWSDRGGELYPRLAERVADGLGDFRDFPDAGSAFESWDTRERVTKYVVNSVRCYEFWGYDWWIPFWDDDFLDFWQTVPVRLRRDQALYTPYVDRVFAEEAGLGLRQGPATVRGRRALPALKRWMLGTPVYPLAREAYRRVRVRRECERHPMAWFGLVPDEVLRRSRGWNSLASFLAAHRLGQLDLETRREAAAAGAAERF